MNTTESKTLFNLKLLSTAIILAILISLIFLSQQRTQPLNKFKEQASSEIKLLENSVNINELVIRDESFVSALSKDKVNFVSYWALWCEPCIEEIPALAKFHNDNPEFNLIFVNIDTKENKLKATQFWSGLKLNTSTYYMPNDNVFTFTRGIPYHQFLDKNLQLRSHFFGAIIGQENRVKKLLNHLR